MPCKMLSTCSWTIRYGPIDKRPKEIFAQILHSFFIFMFRSGYSVGIGHRHRQQFGTTGETVCTEGGCHRCEKWQTCEVNRSVHVGCVVVTITVSLGWLRCDRTCLCVSIDMLIRVSRPMRRIPYTRVTREWKWKQRRNKKDKCRIDFVRSSCRLSGTDELDIFDFCPFIIIFFVSQSKHQLTAGNGGAATAATSTIVRAQIAFIHLFLRLCMARCVHFVIFGAHRASHPGDRTRRKFHRYRHQTNCGRMKRGKKYFAIQSMCCYGDVLIDSGNLLLQVVIT